MSDSPQRSTEMADETIDETIDELFRRIPTEAAPDAEPDPDGEPGGESPSAEPGESELADNGLAHLVLTVVRLLHDVLERQAIRRMENGSLDEDQIEEIGRTLMRQAEELDRLCEEFDIEGDDLEIPIDGVRAIR